MPALQHESCAWNAPPVLRLTAGYHIGAGARSTRSQLPGETDTEEETDMPDVPDEMLVRSRPGSVPHVLVSSSSTYLRLHLCLVR